MNSKISPDQFTKTALVMETLLIVVGLVTLYWLGNDSLLNPISIDHILIGLVLGSLLGYLLYRVIVPLADMQNRVGYALREQFNQVSPLMKGLSASQIAVISIFAGVGEEFLFRFVLQSLLVDWIGVALGIGLASLLFGLVHFVSISYVIATGLIGLLFGWVYHLTDNIILVMTWHAVYDYFAIRLLSANDFKGGAT